MFELSPSQRASLRKKIAQLERAAVDYSWAGAQHPEDREAIKEAYEKAHDDLYRFLGLKP